VITAIARQLTSSDPQAALSWIEKLPDESTRQKALETCVAAVERDRSADSSGVCSAQHHGRYTSKSAGKDFLPVGTKQSRCRVCLGPKFVRGNRPRRRCCPGLSPWSLKIILVARPNWYRAFLVICSLWPQVHLFRSGPAPIRRPRAPGQLPFPMPKHAINFLPT
jgi:hypothetical protein